MASDDFDDDDTRDDDAPRRVPAQTPLAVTILVVLNLLVLPGFLFLLLMDYQARTNWAYQTFLHHVYVWGLPLEEEEKAASLSQESRPRMKIEGDRLQKAFTSRKSGGGPPFASIDEPIPIRIKPSNLDDATLKTVFSGVGTPVNTLEKEIQSLKTQVPAAIDDAASKAVASLGNDEAKKRRTAESVLLPLAWNYKQVEALKQHIDATPADRLDGLVNDAVQRRILVDLLAPLNVRQPGDPEKFTVERAAEFRDGKYTFDLDALKGLLAQRFDAAIRGTNVGEVNLGAKLDGTPRDSVDKRRDVAYLLFVLSQAKVPGTNEPLLPSELDRAQVVAGLYQFAQAAHDYVGTQRVLEGRVVAALQADREGYEAKIKDRDGKESDGRAGGFVQEHDAQVEKLKKIVKDIKHAEARLEDVKTQRDRYQKEHDVRLEHLKAATAKLTDARRLTAKELQNLRELERELYQAQVQLADAADRNRAIAAQIRAAEGLKEGTK
jgi:hypothetical protein